MESEEWRWRLCCDCNHVEGGCGARTVDNEGLQLAERGYGPRYLSHRGGINLMAVKVQEDDVGAGLQPAHQLHQLIPPQLPEAFLLSASLKFSVLPAVAVLAQVDVKREGEGGVERQLQVLREGHGRQGGGRVAKGRNCNTWLARRAAHARFWSEGDTPTSSSTVTISSSSRSSGGGKGGGQLRWYISSPPEAGAGGGGGGGGRERLVSYIKHTT